MSTTGSSLAGRGEGASKVMGRMRAPAAARLATTRESTSCLDLASRGRVWAWAAAAADDGFSRTWVRHHNCASLGEDGGLDIQHWERMLGGTPSFVPVCTLADALSAALPASSPKGRGGAVARFFASNPAVRGRPATAAAQRSAACGRWHVHGEPAGQGALLCCVDGLSNEWGPRQQLFAFGGRGVGNSTVADG